jgi:uncharacterized protein
MSREDTYHSFPLTFKLRVMGEDRDNFEGLVLNLVQKHIPGLDEQHLTRRSSREGRYISVTVQFTAHSKGQLNAIYAELNAHERVLMIL